MKNLKLLCLFLLLGTWAKAQTIQSPSSFLGYELGSHFSRHHQVMDYYRYLANTLPEQVKLSPYGTTYEGRELTIAYISTPENIRNLEQIQKAHMESIRGGNTPEIAVVWLSYNVHGNESVSTEASMQTIFELLTQKQDWLKNTLVIMDPCINPDGRDRYVNWYNQFQNSPYNADPYSKEHREPWLSGRPNHYMFDLNRDWAWLTQKESQARLKVFTQWLPHIHVDFHEQGVDEPYYFAPAAEPLHEVITQWQKDFQREIGKNHARYFDAQGWYYFTKESFDLLYPSYGDTYPTYNGGIGMTYEQGGSGRAGLGVITTYGDTLTLKDRIAHHHTTGLSTVEMASKNALKLNQEFQKFYKGQQYRYKSYVMQGDADKIEALTALLDAHQIEYGFTDANGIKGRGYREQKETNMNTSGSKLVVSTNQLKGTLVKVLFEPETKLNDSLTYDITAWSLPYAYGLDAVASERLIQAKTSTVKQQQFTALSGPSYAWVTDWNSMKDARFLADLLKHNLKVFYHMEAFELEGKSFPAGSLIIPGADNKKQKDLVGLLQTLSEKHNKALFPVTTGFVDKGKDFGSDKVRLVPKVKVAAYSGGSSATLNFGEIWHFFEQQLGYPISVLDASYFSRVDLSDYDVLILPELYQLEAGEMEQIKNWVKSGGKLIAIGDALEPLSADADFGLEAKIAEPDSTEQEKGKLLPYASGEREYIKQLITGAVYKAQVDPTHPLAYGYDNSYFTLKLSGKAYELLNRGNAVYLTEGASPLSGFAGSEVKKLQGNSLVFGTQSLGKGEVVYLVDNPLFRGFWENGKLFFANAVFMVGNP